MLFVATLLVGFAIIGWAMDEVEEGPVVAHDDDGLSDFKLPFPVATIKEFEQRAYLTEDQRVEWVWTRVHHFCEIRTEPGKLLRNNAEQINQELRRALVPVTQFHYRGLAQEGQEPMDNCKWKDHTLESRPFLVILLWLVKNRGMPAKTKLKALKLLLGMVELAFAFADVTVPITAMVAKAEGGNLVSEELVFSAQQGLCRNWIILLQHVPGAIAAWKQLGTRCWLNRCIVSSIDNASLLDIWFFMAYLWCHPKLKILGKNLWVSVGQSVLPELLYQTSTWIDKLAKAEAQKALQMLPSLKTKHGFARKVSDPVNRLLLLMKLKKEKQHRARIAGTHQELGGNTNRLVRYEAYLDCLLHVKALEAGFPHCNQLTVAWDPSTYGGKETFFGVVYAPLINLAAYLPSQQLSCTLISDLDDSLLPLVRSRKLKRLEGYKEIRGLSSSLASIGVSFKDFKVPAGLFCRPLKATETRLVGPDGTAYIVDGNSHSQPLPEIPLNLDLGGISALVSLSDQGPNNTSALNYISMGPHALMLWPIWDPYHRVWNDVKLGLKRSAMKGWKAVLEFTLLANLNYGPFGSGSWYFKKRSRLEDILATKDFSWEHFQNYVHLIAQERRLPEPSTAEDQMALFASLQDISSCNCKGPVVKLMRWFSFFEAMAFNEGDWNATKLLLEFEEGATVVSEKEVDETPVKEYSDHKTELQKLKKRKGTWKLAPTLITPANLVKKDILMSVIKECWKSFAARARDVVSPMQVAELNIANSSSKFWASELLETINFALFEPDGIQHLLPEYIGHDSALVWHADLLAKVLEQRAQSLTSFHCLPPAMYGHLLSPSLEVAKSAHDLALAHYKILLAAEEADNCGQKVEPLATMYWRKSPFIRTLYLAYLQDEIKHAFRQPDSAARKLQLLVTQNLGDSRLIENVHQHGRDLYRSSKAKSLANTTIFANALRSGVLESRQVPMLSASNVDKVIGPQWQTQWHGSVASSLKSKGHHLTKEVQKLMAPQSKKTGHTWASPSAASLFPSMAATQWLFEFWREGSQFAGMGANQSFPSFLARPGAILAQQSTSRLIMPIASAEFSFLGLEMAVHIGMDGARSFVCQLNRESLAWHHVVDLGDWIELPTEPCLVNGNLGPVGWKQVPGKDPLPLEVAVCLSGMHLTHQQMKGLVLYIGGKLPKKNLSRKAMEKLFLETFVPDDILGEANAMIGARLAGDDTGWDSDFSELISELCQDDQNEQDLKEFKRKKKQMRVKRSMERKDVPVPKPKAKPKAKGKAKGRPKAKPGLYNSLLNRAAAKVKEMKKEKQEAAMNDGGNEAAVAPEPPAPADPPPEPSLPEPPAPADTAPEPSLPAGSLPEPADTAPEHSLPAPPDSAPEPSLPQPPGSAGPSKPRQASRRSPEEVLEQLEPPDCSFGISFADHRFTSIWAFEHLDLDPPWCQLRFSRSFALRRGWKDALVEVHKHNWQKWGMVKHHHPLAKGKELQEPGVIPDSIFAELKKTIDSLGEPTRYSRIAAPASSSSRPPKKRKH